MDRIRVSIIFMDKVRVSIMLMDGARVSILLMDGVRVSVIFMDMVRVSLIFMHSVRVSLIFTTFQIFVTPAIDINIARLDFFMRSNKEAQNLLSCSTYLLIIFMKTDTNF